MDRINIEVNKNSLVVLVGDNKNTVHPKRIGTEFKKRLRKSIPYYVLLVPAATAFIIFSTIPLFYGVILSFKDFRIRES